MKKFKNKKRLTALTVAFLLVFVTGAAFALTAGQLDIVGTVTVDTPAVVWYGGDLEVFNSNDAITSTATIIDQRGAVDQRIVWTVDFATGEPELDSDAIGPRWPDGDVFAMLVASAENRATLTADITAVSAEWTNPALAAALGLDFGVDDALFLGELAAGAVSPTLLAWVEWDSEEMNITDDDELTVELVITFDYAPAN
jgi:hypothetical protein